jgi:phosphatidylethanolamine/phosphatidyl-N-methylethanolamine N-methyltransferase
MGHSRNAGTTGRPGSIRPGAADASWASRPVSAAQVARTYRFYAPFYDRVFGAVLEPGRRALARAVCERSPASILEIGVGTGLMLDRYPRSATVVGVDLSEEMLDVARRRAGAMPDRRIELLRMNAESMDFPSGAFDCVTLPYVISVTPDPARLRAEIRRVCRKDGAIFVLNHFGGSRFWWLLEKMARSAAGRIGFRSDISLEEQVLVHDWEVRSVKDVNFAGLSKLIEIRNV